MLVEYPNWGLNNDPDGSANDGWVNALNISARNCSFNGSLMGPATVRYNTIGRMLSYLDEHLGLENGSATLAWGER